MAKANSKSKRAPKTKGARRDYRKSNARTDAKDMRRDREIENTARREFAADARQRRDCFSSQENDPQWYAQNSQLLKDYASYPFGVALGTRLNLGWNGQNAIPGVMGLYYAPSIGDASSATAPINVAMRNIYSYVRHANSGHTNYDAPDLMMYMLAMDSVYMFHSYLKRLLGVLLDYTPLNRYYVGAVVTAMGVNYGDIMEHITDLRGFINQYAVKMGSMCVPNSMSYMARHTWMTEGLYTDSTVAKCQTYLYVPYAFFKASTQYTEGARITSLNTTQLFDPLNLTGSSASVVNFETLCEFGNGLLDQILTSEDFNIMSGDILKAFGPEGVVKVLGVGDGYVILPAYNQEVMSQIENAIVLGGYYTPTIQQATELGTGVLQYSVENGNNVKYAYSAIVGTQLSGSSPMTGSWPLQFDVINATSKYVINMHHSDVLPENVMVASRLMEAVKTPTRATLDTIGQAGGMGRLCTTLPVSTCGSEVLSFAVMFTFTYANDGSVSLQCTDFATCDIISSQYPFDLANKAAKLATFDWHPMYAPVIVTFGASNKVTTVTNPSTFFCDYDNYTVIDAENISNMHMAALLSEFSVPQMGAFSQKL